MALNPSSFVNTPVSYLDSAVGLLATGIYLVTRPLADTYVNGVETPDPAPTTFYVEAVVVPAGAETLRRYPEARRTTDLRSLFVSVKLRTNTDSQYADQVTIGSNTFEVQDVDEYGNFGNLWVCTVQRAARLSAAGGGA